MKCDIKKFFASVDQNILLNILQEYIPDTDILWLLERVIKSFSSDNSSSGLPLGNLTSQLLVNIYMNEFDHFAKHGLKAKYYIRYVDDFVIFSQDYGWLEQAILKIQEFLWQRSRLALHPQKLSITTLAHGVDFLGWVHFPDHRVLRTSTKRSMMRRIRETQKPETVQSYLGLLRHGNTYKIAMNLR